MIENTTIEPGMLDLNWYTAAIYVSGPNTTIERNSVKNSGYLAIAFASGSNISIKNNLVDTCETMLDEASAVLIK